MENKITKEDIIKAAIDNAKMNKELLECLIKKEEEDKKYHDLLLKYKNQEGYSYGEIGFFMMQLTKETLDVFSWEDLLALNRIILDYSQLKK